jgi:hypothetical protein
MMFSLSSILLHCSHFYRECQCLPVVSSPGEDQHTSPDFLTPVLERTRGVDGRMRLMWLPATVGTLSDPVSVSALVLPYHPKRK